MTTKTQHTSGPWKIGARRTTKTVYWNVYGKHESQLGVHLNWKVAQCGQNEEGKANARLIAAAPGLLEACRALVDYADNVNQDGEPSEEEVQAFEDVYNKCIQAVSKAEGAE